MTGEFSDPSISQLYRGDALAARVRAGCSPPVPEVRCREQEEELMRAEFAGAYADYERRVKRLVPFVW